MKDISFASCFRARPQEQAPSFSFSFSSPFQFFFNANLSHIINLLFLSYWVGQYRGIFSSRVMYCPSLRSGQYCHPETEYSHVLPSLTFNNGISYVMCHKVSQQLTDFLTSSWSFPTHAACSSRSTVSWSSFCSDW